ncbi:hypothetical protein [Alteriqipengyuania sp.]|uniref:hypothetical protein n=1 Tax=Alteriqipengyuania sp. TaxID=2800692 RepID=UPI00351690AA
MTRRIASIGLIAALGLAACTEAATEEQGGRLLEDDEIVEPADEDAHDHDHAEGEDHDHDHDHAEGEDHDHE